MYLPKRSASSYKVSSARMMSDAIDLSISLDLMLHNDLVCHTLIILADSLCRTQWTIFQLPLEKSLIGNVYLSHDETILLLARSVCSIEEMAKPVLVI